MKKEMPFQFLISYEEAKTCILKSVLPVEKVETDNLENAAGRILAHDVIADFHVPPFARAAMDGYAVIAKDTVNASSNNPKILKIVDILHAGDSPKIMIHDGECIQIATGAPIPSGANAVIMVEYTEKLDETVSINKPVYPGEHISPIGEDLKRGTVVLRKGDFLTPAKIGVLAALGKQETQIYRKPVVAIIPTGSELLEVGVKPVEGKIFDVNSHTLIALLRQNGVNPVRFNPVSDSLDLLKKLIQELDEYDLIVFSGGSSVGERDLLATAVQELGNILFHGVQIKPGKPTLFGLVHGTPIFGMPGYPTSCLSNAYLFLIPAVRKIARLPPRTSIVKKAKLSKRIISKSGRKQFLTVKLLQGQAIPVFKQSGAITSMAEADGYIVLPENLDVMEEGAEVDVILLD